VDSAIEHGLSSKPRAIQQHFEITALSEIDRASLRGKNCRNRFCWKNLPGRKRIRCGVVTSTSRSQIRTIQINSDNRRARQCRTSHLVCPGLTQKRGNIPRAQVMEATSVSWKSGDVVRLLSGGATMKVIGYDGVGSVICQPLNDEHHLGIYVPPSLLMAADAGPDAGAPKHSTDMAPENA
jgi:hypothetical protein